MAQAVIMVAPMTPELSASHPVALNAKQEFLDDLRRAHEVTFTQLDVPVAAQKGIGSEIVIALTSPAAAGALVALFRLWITRDKRRVLKCAVSVNGQVEREVEISGRNLSDEVLLQLIARALPTDDAPRSSGTPKDL